MRQELNRRKFLQLSSAAAVGIASGSVLTSCMGTYNPKLLNSIWDTPFAKATSTEDQIFREIVRCGVMAPSGHNAQPWKFRIDDKKIYIYPDMERRTPIVDPYNREMYISLGCAIRNMMIGAEHYGYKTELELNLKEKSIEDEIVLKLTPLTYKTVSDSLQAMILRQTTRNEYQSKKIDADILKRISSYGNNSNQISELTGNITTDIYQDKKSFDLFLDYVKEGNRIQLNNSAYFNELKDWIRFSDSEAEEKLDGLYSRAIGQSSTSRWLGKLNMNLGTTDITQTRTDTKLIRSAPLLMAFFSIDSREDWIKTGILLEYKLISITNENLKYAFHNQPCEVIGLRKDFSREFGHKDKMPQVVIRLGYSTFLPRSPRRKLSDVIIGSP
jgi:hypothetical protein